MDKLLRIDDLRMMVIKKVIKEIEQFQEEWIDRTDLDPKVLHRLKEMATVQSIGSSTRIEGSKLEDEEISTFIRNMKITELKSRDEQEVAGYYHALELILDNFDDIELTANNIKGLHKQLMQYSEKDVHHRGNYKTLSNQVVATTPDGGQRTIFKTTPPMFVEQQMSDALAWYKLHIKGNEYHPLVVIGAFIYEFLTIHPFQDGNGRLSRLLTTLLLLRNGYDFVQYASVEQEIERYKLEYYRALMLAQRYRGDELEVIGSWLIFLLRSIRSVTRKLKGDEKRTLEEPPAIYMNRRQQGVMNYFSRHDELSIGDIDRLLPEVSRSTLKYDLARLREGGMITRHGKGRGTVYKARKRH